MAEPILWATLIIAASSLIFAFIAFREVMRTSGEVHEFMVMAKKFFSRIPKDITKLITPDFMAATIEKAVTSGLKNPDGTQVSMSQFINGYAVTFGPAIYQDLKKEIPNYIPLLLNQNPSPGGPPNQGRQSNGQWGSGGLKAATGVAKAAKKLPFGQKVAEYVEGAQALVGLGGALRELKNEIVGMKGGGGNGETETPSTGSDGAMTDWGPPF